MARFLHGLNREVADMVEMQHYVELTDMVHQAIKVEQQLKCRNMARRETNNMSTMPWRPTPKKSEAPQTSTKHGRMLNSLEHQIEVISNSSILKLMLSSVSNVYVGEHS